MTCRTHLAQRRATGVRPGDAGLRRCGLDGDTVIGLQPVAWLAWRSQPMALGTCHPHGAWVDVSLDVVESTVLQRYSH